jgi:hypothetical protein
MRPTALVPLLALLTLAACDPDLPTAAATHAPALARAGDYAGWAPAQSIEVAAPGAHPNFNTPALDGCPLPSRDGKLFFIASTRPGSVGIDIWVATRSGPDAPWGEPVNVGAPINSAGNDFCPMLARDGHTFYFVSNRPVDPATGAPACGGTDIYVSRRREDGTFETPRNLGCDVNSPQDEAGPVAVNEPGEGPSLYFSSFRPGGYAPDAPGAPIGDSDLYVSRAHGGEFRAATLVPGVNSPQDDGQPFIREDARELFFYSNRPGAMGGSNDIYVATRERAHDAWATPVNLGPSVNTIYPETRPSLSWDGTTLYFGSANRPTGEGNTDVYVTRRQQRWGGGR